MIDLPRPESGKHPRMSRLARAAQFSAFAALTGYEDYISEEGRLTDSRGELDEDEKNLLDLKLRILEENAERSPEITVTVFVPDRTKSGGKYVTETGRFKKIDKEKQELVTENGGTFPVGDILAVDGEIFGRCEID
ncbi:MAG: hypothetical protein IKR53_03480 [Clostridia bacterium]|nr:hypothetical protein [Clostridia bacterium]